jgi:nucleoside diphosphate kinase
MQRLESKFRIKKLVKRKLFTQEVQNLYPHHRNKDFFPRILEAMLFDTSIIMSVEGWCVDVRTEALNIRSDWGGIEENKAFNLIHATERPEDAIRELDLMFPGFLCSS